METRPTLLEESESLHRRVRAFANAPAEAGETFESLALEIARFQARHVPGFQRLVDERGAVLDRVEAIPAVPTEAFRHTRVAVHPPDLDVVRFQTSGTTGKPGLHVMRSTATYRALALRGGALALTCNGAGRQVVVALAPQPNAESSSSLALMMRLFMEEFDGRALKADPTGASFDPICGGRWLLGVGGIDVAGIRRAALVASQRQESLLVLATSFALVMLLDALAGARVPAPKGTVVMQTGGYKARTRSISPQKLRAAVARAFRIPPEQVIGEYGMTELTSQLYEGTLPEGGLRGPPGLYLEPPWLRVTPVDPVNLKPVAPGEVGIARFVDLGNVDSAVAIVTQDLVRRHPAGIELLGRRVGASPRGCSLAAEAFTRRPSNPPGMTER